jgi:hypothetical protein
VVGDQAQNEDEDCRCVECGETCDRITADGTPYCEKHYREKAAG